MPIRASQRWYYPIDWTELSRAVRFDRAKGYCESCGRPHGRTVRHLSREVVGGRRGLWWDADWTDGRRNRPGAWRCEEGRALAIGLLPAPDELAALQVQLAFWPGFEREDWPKRSLVVLACCHLDHDPTNNAPSNLRALCQHCHLEHDRSDNMQRRLAGSVAKRARGTAPLPFG